VKYLLATIALVIALFLGWLLSAKLLEPLILKVFDPNTHEKYLDIWFSLFVFIELLITIGYAAYLYKTHKSGQ